MSLTDILTSASDLCVMFVLVKWDSLVIEMKANTNNLTLLIAFILIGCASPNVPNMRSMTTAQLEARKAEIDRKLVNDELGVDWGATRWVSHAIEERNVLKEKEAINNELWRRQQINRKSGRTASEAISE